MATLELGAWQPSTVTLGKTQLRAPATYRPWRSRRGLVNTVRGAFTSPDASWQTTDYPPVSDPAAVAAEGGEAALTFDLPFTTSASMAQRIACIALRQNRRQKSLDWPANLAGLRVAAGHPVAVTLDRLGLAGTTFRVETWRMSDDMGVDLALAEDGSEVYAHDPSAPNGESIPESSLLVPSTRSGRCCKAAALSSGSCSTTCAAHSTGRWNLAAAAGRSPGGGLA